MRNSPLIVGLTGGTGVGKSTVGSMLSQRGASLVDCDQLGRDVVAPGGGALPAIFARFGEGVSTGDKELDRAALAAIVFNDPDALSDLNAITHPAIDQLIGEAIAGFSATPMVVLDMAVLVETNLGADHYEVVVVVESETSLRLDRLAGRGMERADAEARMASQATDEERRAVADHVLTNNGSLDELRRQVDLLWTELGM